MEELEPPLRLPELPNPIQMIKLYKNQRAVLFILGPQIDIIRKLFFSRRKTNFRIMFRLLGKIPDFGGIKILFFFLFYCHQTRTTAKFPKAIHFNPFPGFVSPFSNGTHTTFELNMRNTIWEISSNR